MAQANSQIRSSTSKYTFGTIVQYTIACIVILSILMTAKASQQETQQPKQAADQAFAQVKELLRSHPHPDVRGEFYEMVLRYDFRVSPLENMGADAGFSPVDAQTMRAHGHKPKAEFTPVMHVDTFILQPEYRTRAQLVLYHEFVHYQQWREGRWINGLDLENSSDAEIQRIACMKKWYVEVEAYHKACVLGRSANMLRDLGRDEPLLTICLAEETTFEKTLKDILVPDGASAGTCLRIWSEI